MNQQQKPFGIIAIMIYAALCGILFLLVGAAMLGFTGLAQPAAFFGAVPIVVGVLYFFAVFGIKALSNWSRKLLLWLSALLVIIFVFGMDASGFHPDSRIWVTGFRVISVVLAGVVVYYLTRPRIRALFN